MQVDRRNFLQGAAALAAGSGAITLPAWAEDPIGVASIHDLSGGLDIYGKPMVDAMTLAVEEANAAGGLLGRQIKLINYDTQSSMQLYTQFAQQAALKDKVAVVHGGRFGFGVKITVGLEAPVAFFVDPEEPEAFPSLRRLGGVCRRAFLRAAFGAEVQEGCERGAELAFETGFVAVEEFERAGVVGQGAEGDEGLGVGVFAFV